MLQRIAMSISGVLLIALFFAWAALKGHGAVRAQLEAQPVLGWVAYGLAWGSLLGGTWLLAYALRQRTASKTK